MNTILIIGAGAAGSVVAQKCVKQPDVFNTVHVASRTFDKCIALKAKCNDKIHIHQLDADVVQDTVKLIQSISPTIVINMALPYQDLAIMDACLETKTHYMDTANYEPRDEAKFCYKWQWDYHQQFKDNGILALLGSVLTLGLPMYLLAMQKNTTLTRFIL